MAKKTGPQIPTKRLKILSEDELHVLYGRPEFTAEERGVYFLLSSTEQFHLNELGDVASCLHFILQLGYFKAQHQFHTFTVHDVSEDATYICNLYFPNTQLPEQFKISRRRRLRHQTLILELCHYRYCNQAVRQQLVITAQQRAKVFSQPLYIFRELLQYLAEHRYMAPRYSFFQETIGRILHQEQQRLSQIVGHELSQSDSQALLSLITETDAMYGITRLKQIPKDFSQHQIKAEIQRAVAMKPLYASAQKVLPRLDISNESIKYYASLVDYYSVFRLTQLDPLIVQVYLLCFVLYRYRKLHDHLITALIYHVKGHLDEAKQAAKDRVYESRLEQNRNLAKAGQLLKLFTDPIAPQTPFETVQAQAFMILERPQLDRLATYLSFHAQFDEVAFQWEYIDQISRRFKRQLRPLLRHVEWMAWSGQQSFLWAVNCLKQMFEKKRSLTSASVDDIPTDFIPDSLKQYLYTTSLQASKKILVDRYEFLIYRVLRDGIEAGHLFCRDSVRYRSLEDDLVDPVRWQSKESLLVNAGLSALTVPIEAHLMALEQQLEERFTAINQHIISGQNQHFQFKRRGKLRWTLSQPHDDERLNPLFTS